MNSPHTNAPNSQIVPLMKPRSQSDFEDISAAQQFGPKASILDTIGNTPIVRINNLGPKDVEIYAKLEAFNPLGSVKDRLALGVIEAAERDGSLKPGQTVVEATSGNTGIGLAMVCAQKGYPLVITMAENFSVERRNWHYADGFHVRARPLDAVHRL